MTIASSRSNSVWSLGAWSPTLLKRRRRSGDQHKKVSHQHSNEVNKTDANGRTLLFYAATFDQPEVAIQLLDAGCDVNISDVKGNTALHESIEAGSLDVARVLIKHGCCDVNVKNVDNCTPLMSAAQKDDVEAVKLLHKSGAKLDEHDVLGRTALFMGLNAGSEKTCLYLVKAGCDVNTIDSEGHSALFYATLSRSMTSLDCARKILKAGYKAKKDADWLSTVISIESDTCLLKTDCKLLHQVLSKAGIKLKTENIKTLRVTYFPNCLHFSRRSPKA